MARPISSVHVDIAEFLSETMDVVMENPKDPDRALSEWVRKLAKCLAKRDPSLHAYGAKLLAEAGEFIEAKSASAKAAADEKWRKEREKAEALKNMQGDAGASSPHANASEGMQSHATEHTDQSITDQNRSGKGKNSPVSFFPDKEFPSSSKAILDYLNEKTGKNFRMGKATSTLIRARMNEGFGIFEFKTVIDKKTAEWATDPKMEKYLRPETLFCASKMDGYLNQKTIDRNTQAPFGGSFRGGPPPGMDEEITITGTGG